MGEEKQTPVWLQGRKINEVIYANMLRNERYMIWTDGAFFDVNGRVYDENALRQRMYQDIREYVTDKVSAKVESMMQTLRMECGCEDLPLQETVIHVANGTYRVGEGFSPYKHICRFRLPVNYDEHSPNPHKWMEFLDELLEPEEELLEEEPEEEFFFLSSILARVFAPATPSALRLLARWKSYTASLVRLPKLPVTEPE